MAIYFTAGPSQTFPTLEQHISTAVRDQIGSISHRSKTYQNLHQHTVEGLRNLWEIPTDYSIFFMSSATEIWERLLQNCVENHSVHFVNGSFSKRFYDIAQHLQTPSTLIQKPEGNGFEDVIEDFSEQTELINFTHNESSTGVMQPLSYIYLYKKRYPDAFLTLDVVSSAPFPDIDFSQIDATYFSVQKGFGLPAGLGVLIISPRLLHHAFQLEARKKVVGSYHRFSELQQYALKNQTPATPNVWNIYLLGKVVEDMLKIGIETIREQTIIKSGLLYKAIQEIQGLECFVEDEKYRSATVVVGNCAKGSANWLETLKPQGYVVGDGYGKFKGQQLRISNFPAHSLAQVEELIAALRKV